MSAKWKWYVYILESIDGSFYTGRTWKPELRYDQHLTGLGGKYTAKHPVKRLAYLEEYEAFEKAKLREKQIQGWIREKKMKLISGYWKKLD